MIELSLSEARQLLREALEYESGQKDLPEELEEIRDQIVAESTNAMLFITNLRVVDYGMVTKVMRLIATFEALYSQALQSKKRRTLH